MIKCCHSCFITDKFRGQNKKWDSTLIKKRHFFCVLRCQKFSVAHPGKLLKNQLVCQKINLVSDERTSVKVFTAHRHTDMTKTLPLPHTWEVKKFSAHPQLNKGEQDDSHLRSSPLYFELKIGICGHSGPFCASARYSCVFSIMKRINLKE